MKMLSIETSTMLGGIAIVDEYSGLITETRLNVKSTHSERLMTIINYSLVQAELSLNDIDAFAVSAGPGSFTGLRIGLSTAKGLSYATGKPLVTVPTLEAFAWNFPYSRYPVCLMLDARKAEVYASVFQWEDNGFTAIIRDTSIKPEELFKKLQGTCTIFAGEGAFLYKNMIIDFMGKNAIIASHEKMVPSPANVAVLGMAKAMKGEYTEASAAVPFYIRKAEAEIK